MRTIHWSARARLAGLLLALGAVTPNCHKSEPPPEPAPERTRTIGLDLEVEPGVIINTVSYAIEGNGVSLSGDIDVSNGPLTAFFYIQPGTGYKLTMQATSTDGTMSCAGATVFDVVGNTLNRVSIRLTCQEYRDLLCSKYVCDTRGCGTVLAPSGTPSSHQIPGSCTRSICDGQGNVLTINDDSNLPIDGKECTGDVCAAGTPSNPPLPYGTPCSQTGGTFCDGRGECAGGTTFRVVHVGNGAFPLTSEATATYIEERRFDGTLANAPIALPIAARGASQALTMSGTGTSEGALSLSADGRYLTVAGYAVSPGVADVATTPADTVKRVVARVDALSNIDTTTVLGAAFDRGPVRSATTSDGSGYWVGGSDGLFGGIWYVPAGEQTGTQLVGNPEVAVGGFLELSATIDKPDPSLAYAWTATSGVFSATSAASTLFQCGQVGRATLTLTVSNATCTQTLTVPVECLP